MFKYKISKLSIILISVFLLTFLSMCEDFQDETYKVDDTDAMAIEVFKDTNLVSLMPARVTQEEGAESFTLTYSGNTFNLTGFADVVDVLEDSSIAVEVGEYHYSVSTTKDKQNCLLLNIGADKEVVVYTDESALVNVVDESNTAMDVSREFPVELVAGYFEYDATRSDSRPEPIVQSRSEFDLTAGTYVLKLITTEATKSNSFTLVVIEKQ